MLERLDVRPAAFRLGEVEAGADLLCEPSDKGTLLVAFQGDGVAEWSTGAMPLARGAIAAFPPGLAVRLVGPLVVGSALVRATIGEEQDVFARLGAPLFAQPDQAALPGLLDAMEAEIGCPGVGTPQIVTAMIKQLIIMLIRGQPAPESRAFAPRPVCHPQLDRALLLITARPQDPHSIDSLSRAAGMSRSRFTHHFNEALGRSPMEYLQSVRLAAAAKLLRETDRPIKTVAASVGYASRSHFSRAFRRAYGADPSTFRTVPNVFLDALNALPA